MGGEWKSAILGNEVDLLTGFPFKSEQYTTADDGIRLVRGDNVVQGAMRWNGVKKWPTEQADLFAAYFLAAGDVVLAMDRPWIEAGLKYTAISKFDLPCLLVQRTARIRARKRLDSRFLKYLIGSAPFTRHIHAITTGTAIPHISARQIKDFAFRLPPLEAQTVIGSILGALDDKIELNRRMNATLEAMARALFQSWFVDFDPVRAKLDGRKSIGVDQDTLSLFTAHIERSENYPRPNGWQVTRLGDHVDLVRGNTYKSKLKDLPGPYLLGLGSINRNGGFRGDSLRSYGGESSSKIILRPGELFASLKDVTQAADLLGAVARVPQEIAAGRLTQDTVKLVPKATGISLAYLYRVLLQPDYREYCRGRATGTTNLGLSREDFLNYPVLVPPKGIQNAFDMVDYQIELRIANNRVQSRTLAALRDTLLPKLLSGELRASALESTPAGTDAESATARTRKPAP